MSIVKEILSGKNPTLVIEDELFSRGAFVVEQCKTNEVLLKSRLKESRDAPDGSAYPLTRREVEKMLTKYERREDDSTGFDNPEARSIEGAKKVRWYSPEHNSDFVDEFIDASTGDKKNMDDRPAKLMPYDYKFSVHKPGDINQTQGKEVSDADTTNEKEKWTGEFNKYFVESEENVDDASSDDIKNLFHDASSKSYPIELHLDDGAFVTVEPHQAQHILNSGRVGDVMTHMGSASHFQVLLKSLYKAGEQNAE